MFAVYYDTKRLTKPGTEYEARMDLIRLQAMFLNLKIEECRKSLAARAVVPGKGGAGRF
ncbi:hypothetical protein GCM10020370_22160 [Paenibacillus hodogayensis]